MIYLKLWLYTFLAAVNPELAVHVDKLVETNNVMFSRISNGLLPTPAKSHYTFNLRDLSKVYQGILMYNASHLKVKYFSYPSPMVNMFKLWFVCVF